ncbi:hypothetical protein [Streptacidiphilus albus]|uniref:hypothetical protein n=1 Tax=Streptacidiphilus albus TaxID=105425 RepID=UPI00068F3203|nr:hypothetical protein [Streptacidiphilus albus]
MIIIVIIVVAASSGSKKSVSTSPSPSVNSTSTTTGTPDTKSQADALSAFVAGSGSDTSQMKAAVANHVTKVDANNGSVSVYTDLSGGLGSADGSTATLIVAAATDWAKQAYPPAFGVGLITVYNAGGSILGNGNY